MANKHSKNFGGICVLALLGVAMLALSSCAHVPARHSSINDTDKECNPSEIALDDYILGVDDVVKIITENHPEWSGDYVVDPNGKINIPSLGAVNAYGMVKEQLAKALSVEMEKYINSPSVKVMISKYASEAVYVLGEVNRPGRYSTDGKKLTLRDVIVNAGLPTKNAAISRTFIIAASKNSPRRHVVNLDRVLNHGDLKMNIEIKPGDVVYVPETILGMIGDFINSLLNPFSNAASVRVASGVQY
jgi:polysaccharide export outer membrane protein